MRDLVRPLVKSLESRSALAHKMVVAYKTNRLKADRPIKMRSPYKIQQIELTNKCPMLCPMCPRTDSMTRAEGFMSFDTFKTIVDQMAVDIRKDVREGVTWLHHFGESLLHPEFAKFMNYGADRGLKFGLSVNPIMLKGPTAEKLLSARLDTLIVSLDGHDDASFEKARGLKNAYERSKENLVRFLEEKIKRGWTTKIIFSIIDFDLNKDSIDQVRAFWEHRSGLDEFLVKSFSTFNGESETICALGTVDAQQYPVVVCRHPWSMVAITWDGIVVPCCNDYDKKYPLGNVNTSSLMDIWNGEPMQALRREFLSNKVTNSLCHKCSHLYGAN